MWKRLHAKYPLFLSDFNETWIFSTDFRKKAQIPNFIIIRTVGVELFHAGGMTDAHDEVNSRFRNFANAPKNETVTLRCIKDRKLLEKSKVSFSTAK
jgi:hypothetical protein